MNPKRLRIDQLLSRINRVKVSNSSYGPTVTKKQIQQKKGNFHNSKSGKMKHQLGIKPGKNGQRYHGQSDKTLTAGLKRNTNETC